METTIVYLPQPVKVDYEDTAFYDMIDQYDNLHISDEGASVIVANAHDYIKVDRAIIDIDNPPALIYDDIILFCQREIVRELLAKYQS